MLKKIKIIVMHNPRWSTGIIGGILLYVITWIDSITSQSYDLSIFYLFPLFAIVWFWGVRWGMIMLVVCIGAWFFSDYPGVFQHLNHSLILWNISIRTGFFFLFVFLLNLVKQQQIKLLRLAGQDPLTGLANRRTFYEAATMEIYKSRRFGLAKTINRIRTYK